MKDAPQSQAPAWFAPSFGGLAVVSLFLLAGCVGMDVGGGPQRGDQRYTYANLNSEQRWALRDAARGGDHELVATVSRMAWDNPSAAVELGNYAAALRPEASEQIASAVTRAVARR
jgi:hypothetical protein